MIGLEARRNDSSSIWVAKEASRPCVHTFVIKKTRSRRPFRPLPIQFSDLPRLYSQQLSKKVMPFCCVIEVLKGGAYELSLTYEIRVDLEKRVTSPQMDLVHGQ